MVTISESFLLDDKIYVQAPTLGQAAHFQKSTLGVFFTPGPGAGGQSIVRFPNSLCCVHKRERDLKKTETSQPAEIPTLLELLTPGPGVGGHSLTLLLSVPGHYQGGAASLGKITPPRTGSSHRKLTPLLKNQSSSLIASNPLRAPPAGSPLLL